MSKLQAMISRIRWHICLQSYMLCSLRVFILVLLYTFNFVCYLSAPYFRVYLASTKHQKYQSGDDQRQLFPIVIVVIFISK